MSITSRAVFTEECVRHGLFLGVNSHYLIAVAQLRSAINDDQQGDRIGPFRFTQQEWDASSSAPDLQVVMDPAHIQKWRRQCLLAAVNAYRAQNRLLDSLGRYPSAVELYKEQWPTDTVQLPAKLQEALDATAALIGPAATVVLGPLPPAMAISDAQSPANPPVISTPTQPTPTTGDELFVQRAPWIMEKLIDDFDLTDFQAAGILGNIGHECGGFRLMQEVNPIGGGPGGFGWCQWTGSRRDEFANYCEQNGLEPTSDAANYGNLKRELTETSEKAAIPAVKATTTLEAAVRVFEEKFERANPAFLHLDRRNRWAALALSLFNQAGRRLPAEVARVLDPDLAYQVVATAADGTTRYWVVEQFTDGSGGQTLIRQKPGAAAEVLANDTSVFPIAPGLVPPAVAATLSAGSVPTQPHTPVDVPAPGSDAEISQRVFEQAKKCDETLITRNIDGTSNGKLACAWAVNKVVNMAIGKPVGGGLSTTEMGKVLAAKHSEITTDSQITAGMIVISPTEGSNVGHVGIVAEIKAPLADTVIYSNSSSRGVFSHHFTIKKWRARYGTNKHLPVRFYMLRNT